MLLRIFCGLFFTMATVASGQGTEPVTSPATAGSNMIFRATSFSNMELGWQITNPGTRFLLVKDSTPVVGGQIVMADAVAAKKMAPSNGATSPMLEFNLAARYTNDGFFAQNGDGSQHQGVLKICLAQSPRAPAFDSLECRPLTPNVPREHDDRNHQFLGANVSFVVEGRSARITKWNDSGAVLGREGTSEAPSMTVYHPVYQAQSPGAVTKDNRSPLVLDLDGSGDVDLLDIWHDEVSFDLEGDGVKNRTGWVAPQDGLLVLDRNGNGRIDDGRELFSDFSWGYEQEQVVRRRFANGFAALAQYDANSDGSINSLDPAFKFIKIWRDLNSDGVSTANELTPVDATVSSINLAYINNTEEGRWVVNRGNEVRYVSAFTLIGGESRVVADVYFNQDRQTGVASSR